MSTIAVNSGFPYIFLLGCVARCPPASTLGFPKSGGGAAVPGVVDGSPLGFFLPRPQAEVKTAREVRWT